MCKVNDKFPLVTVIIPTYCRPQYVEIALKSVLDKTYTSFQILVA